MSAPHESIWGSVNTSIEIGIEIYQLFIGKNYEKTCLAISTDRAKEVLSEKALSLGVEKDGFIYFENSKQILAPLYELVKNNAITDKDFLEINGNLTEIETKGKYSAPDYFGKLSVPQAVDDETIKEITNGLSIIKGENDFTLAVHKKLAEYELSSVAQEFGNVQGNYFIFDSTTCAIPLHELSIKNEAVNDYIANKDSLEATLASNFRVYTVWNNEEQGEQYKINANDSMPSMFLQEHYCYAAKKESENDNSFEQNVESELDDGLELER